MDVLELSNNLANVSNTVIAEKQNDFLQSNLGQVVNGAIDIGIKALVPDLLEDGVINIKNSLLNEGLENGVKTAINEAVNLGKSILGIFTGDFKNVQDIKSALAEGGLIDGVSKVLDSALQKAEDKNLVSKNVGNVLQTGKDIMMRNSKQSC